MKYFFISLILFFFNFYYISCNLFSLVEVWAATCGPDLLSRLWIDRNSIRLRQKFFRLHDSEDVGRLCAPHALSSTLCSG
jgi:hypothetical protein